MVPDFSRPAEELAPGLLGCRLVHDSPDGTTAGIIVETEAYHEDDEASHAFPGMTERNRTMFLAGGRAYVYFIYGMHHCFNVVAGPEGRGEAVLIRALEPTDGIGLMEERRGKQEHLCDGPAKLVEAMGITRAHDGADLSSGSLRIKPGRQPGKVVTAERIGISKNKDAPLRFYIAGNEHVSR